MTYSRRAILATGATGTLALTAGCLDFALGNGPLELSAERVAPTDAALEDAGYDEYEIEERSIEETIEVGVERDVEARVWSSIYSKAVEYQGIEREGAFFVAVSIPDVSVLGRSLNPIADMTNEELLGEFMSEIDSDHADVENISKVDSFTLDSLGDGRTVDVFEGESDFEGEPIDVEIPVASFDHEDDLIVLLGNYPAPLAEESANAEVLMESVEHPV
ncbi:DUF6517 family protein [Natronorubrum sp. FCH18a]|uniref:DUF6517 family protein n=1 Tax=Natronorubrum sp. FCH18a TaxID=3447018 RepID=UPI003F51815C